MRLVNLTPSFGVAATPSPQTGEGEPEGGEFSERSSGFGISIRGVND